MVTEATALEADKAGPRKVLIMTLLCMMVVGFNSTAVATILPNLKAEFDMAATQLQWVMAIYTVVGATLVTILSRLGDITGKMKVFFFGMITFAAGSTLVLFSQDAGMLLAGRAAQGAGASALFGTSLSVLTAATPEERRPRVLGIWGAIMGLAVGVGPIVGGLFAQYLSWRGIFVTDLILLAIAFVLGLEVARKGYVPSNQSGDAKFDALGAIALFFMLGPLSFALSNGETRGWLNVWTIGPFVGSVAAAIALLVTSRWHEDPLVEFRYFRHPHYVMAGVGMFVTGFTLFCFFVFFNVFVQSPDVFGDNAVGAGLAVLPFSLGMFVTSIAAPRIFAGVNFRWPILLGMAAMMVGFFLLATTTSSMVYSEIWWKVAIAGIGTGICFALLPRLGLRLLPEHHTGQGSGVINTCLYFGATLGAVLGGMAEAVTTRRGLSEVISALPAGSTQRNDLAHALTHGAPSEVQQLLAQLDPNQSEVLAKALRDLQDDAFDSAMMVGGVAALVGLVLVLLLLRGPVPPLRDAVRFTQ